MHCDIKKCKIIDFFNIFCIFNTFIGVFMQFLKFLHRKNITQAEFADKMEYSRTLIQAWVKGRAFPSYDKILKLIQEGIALNELFNEEMSDRLLRNSQNVEIERERQLESTDLSNAMKLLEARVADLEGKVK